MVTVTVTKSAGTFTGSPTVTIPATGPAVSNSAGDGTVAGEITVNSRTGNWSTDTVNTTNTGSYTNATASFTK